MSAHGSQTAGTSSPMAEKHWQIIGTRSLTFVMTLPISASVKPTDEMPPQPCEND